MKKVTVENFNEEANKTEVTYYDDRLAIIDSITSLKGETTRVKVDASLALLCLKGETSLYINGEAYTIRENDLLLCHPNTILEDNADSMDIEFRCICLSPEYIKQMTLISKSTWSPVSMSFFSWSYRHIWPGEWPGVMTQRRV